MAKTFEQSIAELEEIVEQLENGDVTLDESLGLFEKGIKLSKSCLKAVRKCLTRQKRKFLY